MGYIVVLDIQNIKRITRDYLYMTTNIGFEKIIQLLVMPLATPIIFAIYYAVEDGHFICSNFYHRNTKKDKNYLEY